MGCNLKNGVVFMNNLKDQTSDRLKIQSISSQYSKEIEKNFKMNSFYKYALTNDDSIDDHNNKNSISFIGHTHDSNKLITYTNGYIPLSSNILWIQTFIVNQNYLRQGYGTEFFNVTIKTILKDILIHKIYLACLQKNTGGINFWNSLGFHKATEKTKQLKYNQLPSKIYIFEKNLI